MFGKVLPVDGVWGLLSVNKCLVRDSRKFWLWHWLSFQGKRKHYLHIFHGREGWMEITATEFKALGLWEASSPEWVSLDLILLI